MLPLTELPSFMSNNAPQRIIIFGCPGSGKTTLARKLAALTALPLIHWDSEYWLPNWQKPPRDEWIAKLKDFSQREKYIFEGTFSTTLPAVINNADLIVFTDRTASLCLWRCLTRKTNRPEIPAGCKDNGINRISLQFLWWIVRFNRLKRPGLMDLIKNRNNVLVLTSDKDYEVFLKEIASLKNAYFSNPQLL